MCLVEVVSGGELVRRNNGGPSTVRDCGGVVRGTDAALAASRVPADIMREAAGGSVCIPGVILLQPDLVPTPFAEGLDDRYGGNSVSMKIRHKLLANCHPWVAAALARPHTVTLGCLETSV